MKCASVIVREMLLGGRMVRLDASLFGADTLLEQSASEEMVRWGRSMMFCGCEMVQVRLPGLEVDGAKRDGLGDRAFVFVSALGRTISALET